MKRALLGIALMGLMCAGSIMAQDRDWKNDRDLGHDYTDRRSDYGDMNRDRARIAQNRGELRQELREGDYRQAQRGRKELRNEYREVNRDRYDARRDNRDVRHDRAWGWR